MARYSFDEGGRYRALKTAAGVQPFSGPSPATITPVKILTRVGAIMKGRQQAAFKDQRRGTEMWPKRSVPNVAGILKDLSVGRRPPSRRFEDRPAGVDTGALWKSIDFRVVGSDVVEIGSVLPYAGLIHAGGKTKTVRIDEGVIRGLYKFLYGSKSKGIRYGKTVTDSETGQKAKGGVSVIRKEAKRSLGWLFNRKFRGKQLEFEIPARPFATLERDDVKAIIELVGVEVTKAR